MNKSLDFLKIPLENFSFNNIRKNFYSIKIFYSKFFQELVCNQ